MDKDLRKELLRSGGKKALREYNQQRRADPVPMNTGTRVHPDAKHKKPKYRDDFDLER